MQTLEIDLEILKRNALSEQGGTKKGELRCTATIPEAMRCGKTIRKDEAHYQGGMVYCQTCYDRWTSSQD